MKLIALLAVLTMAGCAQMPGQFILAPNLQVSTPQYSAMTNSNVTVNDLRAYRYLLMLNHGDEKTQLLTSDRGPEQVILGALSKALTSSKVPLSNVDYHLDIVELLTKVKQRSLKFESDSSIVLVVKVNKGSDQLSKTFKRTGHSYGPLKADIAVIERDFNLLLGKLIEDIAVDQELLQYISR